MTQVTTEFPYGTFPVDSSVREHYNQASLSQTYPLPDELPLHHPVLQQLEGVYPVVDTVPPWWTHVVENCDPALKPLVQEVTIREWRSGVLDDKRWRAWKKRMSAVFQTTSSGDMLMHRPKLAALIKDVQKDWFEERGPKDTPEELDLVISFRPEYLLNMSNGWGWTSCQHLYFGSYNERLPASWYDTGVAVAMVVPRGADIWQGAQDENDGIVLARTTLRVFVEQENQPPIIVICRCYDNNKTVLALLLSRLVSLFQQQGLSWGTIEYASLTRLLENGFIGNYQQEEQKLQSMPFWMPSHFERPYVDGNRLWKRTDDDRPFLTATIYRWLAD